ncbi:hypothetical protein PFNF135_05235 [Plasmodium falciparum NF135/5.C10]|uniref:Uncharacterized protein n=1 Tax=Plasmodium falciparum NF135/5.C10 TaxID=1036726 RepID=W4I9M4_PLAFA|nr:hypothetical protein PFNF135_05235 [Plasmodium falciparum NF135/5.C10]
MIKVLLAVLFILIKLENIIGQDEKSVKNICVCDFTDKLNFLPLEKTKILCELKPQYGEDIKIIANKEYEINCMNNSKVFCPLKDTFINNTNINLYSPKLHFEIKDITHKGKNAALYYLKIDEEASDIFFSCSIKPKQVSGLLEGEVRVNLKKHINEEYSIFNEEEDVHVCDFSKGNLDITPSAGFYLKNSRNVSCIYRVIPNKLFLIKLPKLDIVTEKLLPSIVNCLSEFSFINFTLKHVQEGDNYISFNVIFGEFKKHFNLTCSLDLSDFKQEPCNLGKTANITFIFSK